MSSLFRPKEYIKAKTAEEVVNALRERAGKAVILAGGTALHEFGERGFLSHIETLIDIHSLPLRYLTEGGQYLKIGALTTFTDLMERAEIRENRAYGALLDSLRYIRPVQVRNVATVAGSICLSIPYLDFPVALLALDANVKALGAKGERLIPVDKFWVDFLRTALEDGEFVVEIQLPKPPVRTGSAFEKMEITALDWALVNVAVRLTLNGERLIAEGRIALGGGVGPTPHRAFESERLLAGKPFDEELIEMVVNSVKKEVTPISDFKASSDYRRHIAGVLVKRALVRAFERATGAGRG